MMDSLNIQYYKEQLIEYLRSTKNFRNADETKVQKLVDAIEVDLLQVIQTNLHVDLKVVYEFINKEDLRNLINETNRGKSLAVQNDLSGGLLRNAISFYIGYLDSKKHPLSEQEKKRRKKIPSKETKPTELVPKGKEGLSSQKPKAEVPEPESFDKLEGKKYEASVTRYERDRGNRKACIAHYGYVCQVCGMNFEQAYGELGKEFIEVHHLHPVAHGERKVNPVEDLIPLCSNCHSMIHRQDDVSEWKKLRDLFVAHSKQEENNV